MPKKILLLHPDGHIHRLRFGPWCRSMREAPLTMPVLAALAKGAGDFQFRLVDESIEPIPAGIDADLVGISVLTGTACRAYELASLFRTRKIPVVLGGVHVSILPDEARRHADAIVIGPAEESWPRLLRDFSENKLQPEYRASADLRQAASFSLPEPRYDLLRRNGYAVRHTVTSSRGCRQSCDFCTVAGLGLPYARRPVAEVLRDLTALPSRLVVFNDVSIADDIDHATELFTAMAPLGKRWGGLASTRLLQHPELVETMARSGCQYLLIGFESGNPAALSEIHKSFNQLQRYRLLVDLLHRHRISVQGTFIFGFDADRETVFEETVSLVQELGIDIPRYSILTPYPGTRLFERLDREGRILSRNWADYDTMHVVFEPRQMSPETLYAGFKRAYRDTFRLAPILGRWRGARFQSLINLAGNLTYRRFAARLQCDPRYQAAYSREPYPQPGGAPGAARPCRV